MDPNRITAFWNDLEEEDSMDDEMGNLEEYNSLPKKPITLNYGLKRKTNLIDINSHIIDS